MTERIPTVAEVVAEFQRQFPGSRQTEAGVRFLAAIIEARRDNVGFGWMRQAIGITWRAADPVGYIDDERVISAHEGGQLLAKLTGRNL